MMRMAAAAQNVENCIDLTLGEPDAPTPPEICEALFQAAIEGCTHYAPGLGLIGLRDAISEYWAKKYNLRYGANEIFVTTGGSQASLLAMQAILNPGEEVILLEPFFTFYEQHITQAGGVPLFSMTGLEKHFLPGADEVEAIVTDKTKAIIVNSPCNPTGAVYPRQTLEGLARIAEKHDLLVISDELYEAFVYGAKHIPFATLPGMQERTITIGGMSKAYAMTGWRIGYAMGPAEIIKTMQVIGAPQTICVNTMVQEASEFAIRNCDKRIESMVSLFEKRVQFASELFASIPGLKITKPSGSFYLFIDVAGTGMNGEEFAVKMLEEAGVVTVPGLSFGPHCANYIRVACTVSNETMQEAVERIKAVL